MTERSALTVHHLENSRSLRILWALEELGLPYELVEHKRDPKTLRAPVALRGLHPLGKAPIVTLQEDGEDIVLAESGAILEHFVDATGKLAPARGTSAWRHYRYFMHYAEGSLMPPLLVAFLFTRIRTAPLPFFVKPIAKGIADKVHETYTGPELTRHFDFIEQHLGQHPYFAGEDFTVADIQMFYAVDAGMARAGVADVPHIDAWIERLKARDGYKKAVARGGENVIPGS